MTEATQDNHRTNDKPQTVLLVGANGGVGLAILRQLLQAGHDVIATVSRAEKLAGFRHDFPEVANAFALGLDNADLVAAKINTRLPADGDLDAVIFCPAIAPFSAMETLPLQSIRDTFEVNVVSALAIYQAVLPKLRKSNGRIVFVGSLSGRVAAPTMGGYVSSKFALEGLIDTMRQEVGRLGVKVILLQPGSIDTPMVDTSLQLLDDAISRASGGTDAIYRDVYQTMRSALAQQQASGTSITPEHVAAVAIEAITVAEPRSRYPIGADAHALIEASRTQSDEEIDAIILGYRSI